MPTNGRNRMNLRPCSAFHVRVPEGLEWTGTLICTNALLGRSELCFHGKCDGEPLPLLRPI